MLIRFFFISLLIIFSNRGVAQMNTYYNPVIPGFHPDPSVCRVGEDYYLVTSSFEFFPGVPIYHSKDLIHWKQIGHVLTRRNQLDLAGVQASQGIFAPTIRYHNGTFYMITTNVNAGGNFYVTATNPAGPWSDPIWVDSLLFDPSLFFDTDGKIYYTRRGNWDIGGTQQAEINIRTGQLLTPLKKIADGFVSTDQEGPHLYKINGWYYLMCAEGGSRFTHAETIGRGKSPWGPFEGCPHNPILANHDGWFEVRTTGHGDLFEDHQGNWWLVHLATRHPHYNAMSVMGRETFLLPVTWQNGWPVVNQNGKSRIEVQAPTLPLQPFESEPAKDDFDSDQLRFCWNFIRNPRPESWSLTDNPGVLRLYGQEITLNDLDSPAFIGRRQQHYECSVRTLLQFVPTAENEEAGLTCYMRDHFHYDIFLTRRNGQPSLVVRKQIADINTETVIKPMETTALELQIMADQWNYHLGYLNQQGDFVELDHASCQIIATEVASVWTGMYFGMYATGNGKKCQHPADFDWFIYEGKE